MAYVVALKVVDVGLRSSVRKELSNVNDVMMKYLGQHGIVFQF